MSMQDDDEYDLDDELLDEAFEEDLEEGLEDFDEDISFDEDEVLFEDDNDNYEQEEELLGAQKEKRNFDLDFNKIVVIGAVLVGLSVLVFQVMTKTAEQRVEIFRSVLTMKGASDGEVFGESQVENIATISPQKQQEQKAFLYEPEALNNLPDNLKDGQHISDIEIQPLTKEEKEAREQAQKTEQLVQVEGIRAQDEEAQRGEFVSVTGELVKPTPRAPKTQSVQERASRDYQPTTLQKANIEPSVTTGNAVKNIATNRDNADQARQELDFVPIEKVTVKQMPKQQSNRQLESTTSEEVAMDREEEKQPDQESKNSSSDAELLALKREIEQLQKEKSELEALRKEKAALEKQAAQLKKSIAESKVEIESGNEDRSQPASKKGDEIKVAKEPVKKKVSPPAQKKTAAKTSSSTSAKTVSSWQLRAAQPGKAWISPSGKRDMIAVTAGDTVKDLGKVVAISNQNGKWVVIGTEGRIVQ